MTTNYRRPANRILRMLGVMTILCTIIEVEAHHSFGAFDLEQQSVLRGTVVSFQWVNPHVWTIVRRDGDPVGEAVYRLEGMSPDFLGRRGWNRLTLQAGDSIEVTYFPFRDERPGGMFLRATLADGTLKVMVDAD